MSWFKQKANLLPHVRLENEEHEPKLVKCGEPPKEQTKVEVFNELFGNTKEDFDLLQLKYNRVCTERKDLGTDFKYLNKKKYWDMLAKEREMEKRLEEHTRRKKIEKANLEREYQLYREERMKQRFPDPEKQKMLGCSPCCFKGPCIHQLFKELEIPSIVSPRHFNTKRDPKKSLTDSELHRMNADRVKPRFVIQEEEEEDDEFHQNEKEEQEAKIKKLYDLQDIRKRRNLERFKDKVHDPLCKCCRTKARKPYPLSRFEGQDMDVEHPWLTKNYAGYVPTRRENDYGKTRFHANHYAAWRAKAEGKVPLHFMEHDPMKATYPRNAKDATEDELFIMEERERWGHTHFHHDRVPGYTGVSPGKQSFHDSFDECQHASLCRFFKLLNDEKAFLAEFEPYRDRYSDGFYSRGDILKYAAPGPTTPMKEVTYAPNNLTKLELMDGKVLPILPGPYDSRNVNDPDIRRLHAFGGHMPIYKHRFGSNRVTHLRESIAYHNLQKHINEAWKKQHIHDYLTFDKDQIRKDTFNVPERKKFLIPDERILLDIKKCGCEHEEQETGIKGKKDECLFKSLIKNSTFEVCDEDIGSLHIYQKSNNLTPDDRKERFIEDRRRQGVFPYKPNEYDTKTTSPRVTNRCRYMPPFRGMPSKERQCNPNYLLTKWQ